MTYTSILFRYRGAGWPTIDRCSAFRRRPGSDPFSPPIKSSKHLAFVQETLDGADKDKNIG